MLESTEKGGVRNSIQNCLTVFQYDPVLSGAVAKNLLTERIDLLKPIGRKRRTGGKAMTDTDMKYIRLYLEKTYGLTSEKKIADAADLAADANGYHPIRDYLKGLSWDGTERIRFCLRHFLGADTDQYTFEALRLFLLGAIRRAFCPGCKFEVMLCLVGGQGAGNKNKCAGAPPEPVETEENAPEDTEPETGGNPGMLLAVLAVAVVGGGAAFYFKVIRPKQQKAAGPEEDYAEPEDYEDDGPPWDEDDENSEEDEE